MSNKERQREQRNFAIEQYRKGGVSFLQLITNLTELVTSEDIMIYNDNVPPSQQWPITENCSVGLVLIPASTGQIIMSNLAKETEQLHQTSGKTA